MTKKIVKGKKKKRISGKTGNSVDSKRLSMGNELLASEYPPVNSLSNSNNIPVSQKPEIRFSIIKWLKFSDHFFRTFIF